MADRDPQLAFFGGWEARPSGVILPSVSRSAAFLVGIVAFVAFAGLYALSWIAAFAFLALWLVATVLYRRRHRP
jgi:hypothetical protein